jgi:hypothetical protein
LLKASSSLITSQPSPPLFVDEKEKKTLKKLRHHLSFYKKTSRHPLTNYNLANFFSPKFIKEENIYRVSFKIQIKSKYYKTILALNNLSSCA